MTKIVFNMVSFFPGICLFVGNVWLAALILTTPNNDALSYYPQQTLISFILILLGIITGVFMFISTKNRGNL